MLINAILQLLARHFTAAIDFFVTIVKLKTIVKTVYYMLPGVVIINL